MISDLIKNLRRVRKYSDKTVSKEDMQYIMDAGVFSQFLESKLPCIFGVVNDRELISQLSKCCGSQRWMETAPVVIAFCTARMTDEEVDVEKFRLGKLKEDIYDIDSNVLDILCANGHQSLIAAENMALAALELGIGSCIISNLDVYKASKVLRVPNSHLVTYLMTIGYEDGKPQKHERSTAKDVVFYNLYD